MSYVQKNAWLPCFLGPGLYTFLIACQYGRLPEWTLDFTILHDLENFCWLMDKWSELRYIQHFRALHSHPSLITSALRSRFCCWLGLCPLQIPVYLIWRLGPWTMAPELPASLALPLPVLCWSVYLPLTSLLQVGLCSSPSPFPNKPLALTLPFRICSFSDILWQDPPKGTRFVFLFNGLSWHLVWPWGDSSQQIQSLCFCLIPHPELCKLCCTSKVFQLFKALFPHS